LLTLSGLYLAEQGELGQPVTPQGMVKDVAAQAINYLIHHPKEYVWHKELVPAFQLVSSLFFKSTGLLLASLIVATIMGGGLGLIAAISKHKNTAPVIVFTSILGVSTPSFLLGMLFWVLNVKIMRLAGLNRAILPPIGFGWDNHLVMPALVLAARPLAQIMQMTYISMSEVLYQDYMRSARAKGLSERLQLVRHALPNILIPVLTTLGTSLRFSLASLPVVESFFIWEGIGLAILSALPLQMPALITDLIVSLGLLFLIINLGLEVLYPFIDPRLRKGNELQEESNPTSWFEQWDSLQGSLREVVQNVNRTLKRIFTFKATPPVVPTASQPEKSLDTHSEPPKSVKSINLHEIGQSSEIPKQTSQKKIVLRSIFTNIPFLCGIILLLGLILLAFFGEQFTQASPFETHRIISIEGTVYGPPFEPIPQFPWGSDLLGRDMQALVLAGARQTLTLAVLATIARMALGILLGMMAGWWQRSWLDQFIQSLISIWSAFPTTIFAMLVILGLGIQQGMNVFIIGLCVVGWGEIAQYIRGQVISQKPLLYIEAARSVGAGPRGILIRHILPHLIPSMLVLAVMEMGSVLMILAELGFLNVFLGGGFRVEVFGVGNYAYSDIPEWGALLANIRDWWRSYPWLAWYPGSLFFISILTFNVLGEGLRRFLEESRINLNRFLNRYTLLATIAALIGAYALFRSATPMNLYRSQAMAFDAQNTAADIERLTSLDFKGREAGTEGSLLAAEYIAGRMEEIGLFPAGEKNTYIQKLANPKFRILETPVLEILGTNGKPDIPLKYREDFVERAGGEITYGEGRGAIIAVGIGEGDRAENLVLDDPELFDKIIILYQEDLTQINLRSYPQGMLLITEDQILFEKKYLFLSSGRPNYPQAYITPETADLLLKTAGLSLSDLNQHRNSLPPDASYISQPGAEVHLAILGDTFNMEMEDINVIGYIPGTGSATGERLGEGMDNQVVLISAYFDGLGISPDGTFYPGANDNASGVATMLEIARVLKEGIYQPKKTVVFVAWSGGERGQQFGVWNAMNAKTGFGMLTMESVIELSGVGGGTGNAIALGQESSYRLVTVFQEAANRMGTTTTTRGRSPHFDLPAVGTSNRTALSAFVSWSGSDQHAHTVHDTLKNIDYEKIDRVGKTTTLAITILSRETDY